MVELDCFTDLVLVVGHTAIGPNTVCIFGIQWLNRR
jgi:hypothetical protein